MYLSPMDSFEYTTMSGAGNRFVVLDGRHLPFDVDLVALSRDLCSAEHPHGGVDGLIAVYPGEDVDFEMRYYNRDGSTGMMCGNGGRCALRFAIDHEMVVDSSDVRFVNAGVEYGGKTTDQGYRIFFPDPRSFKLRFKISLMGDMRTCHYADVGTPHAVLFVDDMGDPRLRHVAQLDLNIWGPPVRHYPDFGPEGVNANFVEVPGDGAGILLRTFERGVEAETGACGTGAIASAIIASTLRGLAPPVAVTVTSGRTLLVDFRVVDRRVVDVSLEGDAEVESTSPSTIDT